MSVPSRFYLLVKVLIFEAAILDSLTTVSFFFWQSATRNVKLRFVEVCWQIKVLTYLLTF